MFDDIDVSQLDLLCRRLRQAGDLRPHEIDRMVTSAERVLARGPVSTEEQSTTGLAVGYVQSGKTLSMTALAAKAADTGYRLIVGLLGTKINLFDQNYERLRGDLGVGEAPAPYSWRLVHIGPTAGPDDVSEVQQALTETNQVVLALLMKHHSWIDALAQVLRQARAAAQVPALVLDDEADQASLNSKADKQEMSTTYARIRAMRAELGPHLYVQYTATPFAPLLLQPHDDLAPQFAEFLEPGDDYVGGATFFVERADEITREVAEHEGDDPEPKHMPEGLRQALLTFFISAVAQIRAHEADGEPDLAPPVSMLVHPAREQRSHQHHRQLVRDQLGDWKQRLQALIDGRGSPDDEQLADEVEQVAGDLRGTGADPDGGRPEAMLEDLYKALCHVSVWMVNTAADGEREIDWKRTPLHVLIGGDMLDRGYTVKGLTVTYMTRKASEAQADTVEQRARSFGYKRALLPYLRFFAPPTVLRWYRSLVHTEEALRSDLKETIEDGGSPADFARERQLILASDMRPTRPGVAPGASQQLLSGWRHLQRPSLKSEDLARGWQILERAGLLNAGSEQVGNHQQRTTVLPLVDLVESVLAVWPGPSRSAGWPHDELIELLRKWTREEAEPVRARLRLMRSPGDDRPRERSWEEPKGIRQLFQGRDSKTMYPGDRALRGQEDEVVLQIHHLWVRWATSATTGQAPLPAEALTLALHIPQGRMTRLAGRRGVAADTHRDLSQVEA